MAEDETSQETQEETEDNQKDSPSEVIVKKVTNLQWLAMIGLSAALLYLYVVWPLFFSDSEKILKDPQLYLDKGRHQFEMAHTQKAFPRNVRLNTLEGAKWQFSQARRAGGDLSIEDLFRWGYASLQVAEGVHAGIPKAIAPALDIMLEAHQLLLKKEAELSSENSPMMVREQLNALPVHPAKVVYSLAKGYMSIADNFMNQYIKDYSSKNYNKAIVPYNKAIHFLKKLEKYRLDFEQSKRLKGKQASSGSGLILGASPYHLQEKELFQSGLMLGKALAKKAELDYKIKKDSEAKQGSKEATKALNAYLVSTKSMDNQQKKSLDRETRHEALTLLSNLHVHEARRQNQLIKKIKGQKEKLVLGQSLSQTLQHRDRNLKEAHRHLSELFSPEYQAYGLRQQHILFVEVNTKLGLSKKAEELCDSFNSPDPHERNEVKLWQVKASLDLNPNADVLSTLNAIATESDPKLRLAAMVMLGDVLAARGNIDQGLGSLIPSNQANLHLYGFGSWYKVASQYPESDFDNNRFVDKFNLVKLTMERARLAELNKNEDLAIRLYRFLLKEFTVQQGSVIQGIAKLQASKGHTIKKKDPHRSKMPLFYIENPEKDYKHWFKTSAHSYLRSIEDPLIPFEKATAREGLFQAGKAFFNGEFYSDAYETFGKFIEKRPEDPRINEARHKKGISALYRDNIITPTGKVIENKHRYREARKEFMANLSKQHPSIQDDHGLPLHLLTQAEKERFLKLYEDGFFDKYSPKQAIDFFHKSRPELPKSAITKLITQRKEVVRQIKNQNKSTLSPKPAPSSIKNIDSLKKVLQDSKLSSRDIWSYQSLLELGNTYYAEHRYPEATMVYDHIRNDGRFTPRSEMWRKAAYAQARMSFDRVLEKKINPDEDANWEEAIHSLEDLLMTYGLKHYETRFSKEDKALYKTFQKDNAHIKFLLARALIYAKQPNKAIEHANELLDPSQDYDLNPQQHASQLATQQNTQALLAQALYDSGRYKESMEQYRRAHDQNLDSFERPFYSLGIVDCLVAMNSFDKAINRLKRIKWEFEEFFEEDAIVLKGKPQFSREGWIAMVDQRIAQLQKKRSS